MFILLALVLHGLPRVERVLLPGLGFAAITLLWLVPLVVAIDGQLGLLSPFVGAVNQAGLSRRPSRRSSFPCCAWSAGLALVRPAPMPRLRWYLLAGMCLLGTQYPRGDTIHLAWSAPLLLVVGAAVLRRVRPGAAGVVVVWAMFLCLPVLRYRVDQVRLATTTIAGLPVRQRAARAGGDLGGPARHRRRDPAPHRAGRADLRLSVLTVAVRAGRSTQRDPLRPPLPWRRQPRRSIRRPSPICRPANVRVVVVASSGVTSGDPPGDNAPLEDWLSPFHEVGSFGQYRVLVRPARAYNRLVARMFAWGVGNARPRH